MRIWLVEPYLTGSHKAWAEGYQSHSRHAVQVLSLPGRFWKWRMQGGAVTLARMATDLGGRPDLILASDMLNVPLFLSLSAEQLAGVPLLLYFHENQLTYPLQPGEKRDLNYGFINFASALCADALCFNSAYHLESFFADLPRLLKHFPDYNELAAIPSLRARASVLPLGLDLLRLDAERPPPEAKGRALLLWNHRWEYDKDPAAFFGAIDALAAEGLDFGLLLLGESFRNQPAEFLAARERLPERIEQFGYVEDPAAYARFLWQADLVVSTALHDFFGAAVVEACYCNCFPVLPRRLSYPELVPKVHHSACLYSDADGLLERLRHAIRGIGAVRAFSLHEHMARYDWSQMAPRYDDLMEWVVLERSRTEAFTRRPRWD